MFCDVRLEIRRIRWGSKDFFLIISIPNVKVFLLLLQEKRNEKEAEGVKTVKEFPMIHWRDGVALAKWNLLLMFSQGYLKLLLSVRRASGVYWTSWYLTNSRMTLGEFRFFRSTSHLAFRSSHKTLFMKHSATPTPWDNLFLNPKKSVSYLHIWSSNYRKKEKKIRSHFMFARGTRGM